MCRLRILERKKERKKRKKERKKRKKKKEKKKEEKKKCRIKFPTLSPLGGWVFLLLVTRGEA